MLQVSITELRRNLPAFLDRVREGARVEITRRGRVVARITPVEDQRERARRELVALRRKASVGDVESPIDDRWNVDGRS